MILLVMILVIFIGWIFIMALTENKSDRSLSEEETTDIKNASDNVEQKIGLENEKIKTNEIEDLSKEFEKREKEEVSKMSEERRNAFYQFKEEFKKIYIKNAKEELGKNSTEEKCNELASSLDYIALFEIMTKKAETEQCLEILYENCFILENVHNLAYELNPEYKILWDNLNEESKKQFIKARKIKKFGDNVERARWGFATMGLTALGEKALKKRQDDKIVEYVTSEGFTNICIIVNTNQKYYGKEKKEDEC